MKLFYWDRKKIRNFGDELNPWLWERLLPEVFDDEEQVVFVGIGSLLNDLVPKAKKTIVFGTGVGYGRKLPIVDDTWKFYAVRGPRSAEALGLKADLGIIDPAVWVSRYFTGDSRKRFRFSFMPHHESSNGDWQSVCDQLNINYIDPCWDIEKVMSNISQSEILLAEAMHGAIVADALRVPWICVHAGSHVLPFKWDDWCSSVDVAYEPNQIPPLHPRAEGANLNLRTQQWWRQNQVARALNKIVRNPPRPKLSTDIVFQSRLSRLDEKLEAFKHDLASGYFAIDN